MVKQNCSSCLKLMAIEPVSSLLLKIIDFLQAPRHPFLAHQACVWTCRCVKLTNSGHSASEGKSSRFWRSFCHTHAAALEAARGSPGLAPRLHRRPLHRLRRRELLPPIPCQLQQQGHLLIVGAGAAQGGNWSAPQRPRGLTAVWLSWQKL